MKHFTKGLCTLLVMLMILATFGIGFAEEEKVTIRYAMWGDTTQLETLEKTIIEPFEAANPNIDIEANVFPWGEYWTKMQANIAGGEVYDVYDMSIAYVWEYAHKGLLLNIDEYYDDLIAEYGEDYLYTGIVDELRYPDKSGSLYAFPYGWVASVLFYNKTMFDEANLEYPTSDWTYDDMWAAAEKLTSGAGPAKKYGFVQSPTSNEFMDAYINAAGGYVLSEDYTECLINQEPAVKALEELYSYVEKGVIPKPEDNTSPFFMTGKGAMSIGNIFSYTSYKDITDFEWDIAMVPKNAETGKRVIYGGPDSVCVSSATEHPDEAVQFLFWHTIHSRTSENIAAGTASIVKSLNNEVWATSEGSPANKMVVAESGEYMKGADFCYKWSEWRGGIVSNELTAAFNGQIGIQEACDKIVEQVNAILAEVQ